MKRETLKSIMRFLLRTLTSLEFQGIEHVPPTGAALIATNHLSRVDIPVLFVMPVREDLTALVADKYQRYPLFRWFTNTAQGIWLDRTKADFSAFKASFELLKQGKALGISPEGTRSETGQLLEGKAGTVLLASKAGVPVVPVAITGTEDVFKKLSRFQRPKIIARFGPALHVPPLDRDRREEQMAEYTTEIMCRLAALLPESYRGFYRDYPRVAELRSEWGLEH